MTLYNIIHGPEIWIAIMIWCIGAACGIVWTWVMVKIAERGGKR